MLLRRPAVARRIERLLRPERLSTIQRSAMLLSLAAIVVVTGGSLAADALRRPGGPNVLLITIDTLRADHLGIYGRFREPAPHLAALAARGTLFTNAVAQAPWTLPSIASLQTGLYPREHGAIYPDLRVGEPRTILSEYLRDAGYATAVVSSWLFVSKAHGFAQGVDRFEWLRPSEGEREMPAPEITGRGVRLLREMAGKPFYLWLHYVEPHTPYLDHEEWDFAGGYDGPLEGDIDITRLYRERNSLTSADLDHVRDLYDEEIAFMDRQIGVLLDELDRLGLRETTMIVVAGDHGEEFQERGGFGHHHQVYQEVIRVPLIIVEPAGESIGTPDQQAERVVDRVVEIREVARTILTRCGISAPEVPGNGLLHELPAGEAIVAVSEHFDRWKRIERNIAVIGTGWKMIENVPAGSFELYDLGTDPGETIDLAASTDPVAVEAAARLSRALRELRLTGSTEPSSAPLSEEERDRMRSLGYLE
jgi:arylsulfatase A-like enzyme